MHLSSRSWIRLAFAFLCAFGVAFAITGMLVALPKPAAGGTCGPGAGSEAAIQALFAPGSVVANGYTYYAGRTIAPVKIVWNAKRSTSDLSGVQLGVSLSNGVPVLSYDSSQLWTSYSKTTDASGATVFSIRFLICA